MTTYQRRGGQYKTRSGATAYRKGVKGQRGKATVKRSAKRFYAKNRPLRLGVGAAVLATAWVHAPLLVIGGAAFAGVGLAAPHVRRAVKTWRSWQATPDQRPLARHSADELKQLGLEKFLMRNGDRKLEWRVGKLPADHPFQAGGRPPLFMCATCNKPHPRTRAAA
jgi:hypothetical protein